VRVADFDSCCPLAHRRAAWQSRAMPRGCWSSIERLWPTAGADLPDCSGAATHGLHDTRVIPARLAGRRGAARVELTLHRRLGDGLWLAFAERLRVVFGR